MAHPLMVGMPESFRPTVIDLFSGAGGLTLGFEQAGFDVLASVEYDPIHAAVHEYNFPLTETVCADVESLTATDIAAAASKGAKKHRRELAGDIDVIVGGPPCQGFSLIGRRVLDDPRNRLVFRFFEIIRDLRPRYFVMENVPGMASGTHSGIVVELLEKFRSVGYTVPQPQLLQAAEFGVPQDRRRLFVVGFREDQSPITYPQRTTVPAGHLFGADKDAGVVPLFCEQHLPLGPTVWDAIGDLPDLDSFVELWESDCVRLPKSVVRKCEQRASSYARAMRGADIDPSDFSYPRVWDRYLLSSSLRTKHNEVSMLRFRQTSHGETEVVSRFAKLSPDGLSNTLRAGSGSEKGAYTSPRPIHPYHDRVISVREAARLHSFPDWFRFHRTKWHGFRQVGNSVPPLLARALGEAIRTGLGIEPARPKRRLALKGEELLGFSSDLALSHFGLTPSSGPQPRQRMTQSDAPPPDGNRSADTTTARRYDRVLERIFEKLYEPGAVNVYFRRDDIEVAARELGLDPIKNPGDILYSFRNRTELPETIRRKAPEGSVWAIRSVGRGRYCFAALRGAASVVKTNPMLAEIEILDSTPGIVAQYALGGVQSILATVRYNRLVDVFTGVTCCSLQSHLVTTVTNLGQVVTDEVYLGVNAKGTHFVFPVQAKGVRDVIGVIQIEQNISMCEEKFPNAICRPIAAQELEKGVIALLEFQSGNQGIRVVDEKHYRIIRRDDTSAEEHRET